MMFAAQTNAAGGLMDIFWGFITLPLKFLDMYLDIIGEIISLYIRMFTFWLTLPQQIMNMYA